MKIIATMPDRKFLVECDEEELAKICGAGYAHLMKVRPAPGLQIPVHDLWSALEASRARKEDIEEMAKSLVLQATRLRKINALLAHPIVEVEVGS